MNDDRIIQCQKADWKLLQTLALETFKRTYESKNDPAIFAAYLEKAFNDDQIKKELANPHSTFYFLKYESQIVGYFKINELSAQTELKTDKDLEIERIYLKASYQGKGLGKVMIDKVVDIAKAKGKSKVWLGVWEENPSAIAFYERMGFSKFGTHTFTVGPEEQLDFLMEKKII